MASDSEIEEAYRLRSTELRGLAASMSGDRRDMMLDVADHWETLAQQAGAVARSKKLIKDWESGKA
jgi:hypothetical protein